MKEIGVLLPIFSLPSKYGIGDFGNEAYEFIDILSANNIKYWQILPIDEFDRRTFSPISFYALEEDYLSLDKLYEYGLIEKPEERRDSDRIVRDNFKYKYVKEAYEHFKDTKKDYNSFCSNPYIQEFAEYYSKRSKLDQELIFFEQYILSKQWKDLKNYANSKNVKIVGDMPVYPSFNSCEIAYHSKCYQLEDGQMKFMAGTPPDHYNRNGQVWYMPVYDLDYIRKDNYNYLIDRYKEHIDKFDIVRIDHFKIFDEYYKIPVGKLAKQGKYEKGFGTEFIEKILKFSKPEDYWIEDLGDINEKTKALRDAYNFTGQDVIMFSFDLNKGIDKGFNKENCIRYTGNHDTSTIVGWYSKLPESQKGSVRHILESQNCLEKNINEAVIKYCMKSHAKVSIIPIQDVLGLDDRARINQPGSDNDKNWSWKLIDFDQLKEKIQILKTEERGNN